MLKKEEVLAIKTYEEFDRRRDEFEGTEMDKEMFEHIAKLFPKVTASKEELYRTPPGQGNPRIIGR